MDGVPPDAHSTADELSHKAVLAITAASQKRSQHVLSQGVLYVSDLACQLWGVLAHDGLSSVSIGGATGIARPETPVAVRSPDAGAS